MSNLFTPDFHLYVIENSGRPQNLLNCVFFCLFKNSERPKHVFFLSFGKFRITRTLLNYV